MNRHQLLLELASLPFVRLKIGHGLCLSLSQISPNLLAHANLRRTRLILNRFSLDCLVQFSKWDAQALLLLICQKLFTASYR